MSSPSLTLVADDVKLGRNVRMRSFVNLYGCVIGDNVRIGTFVEIQKGVTVGNNCKIQSHSFLCEGVALEDEVFVGHNVTFINDRFPRATTDDGTLKGDADWKCEPTVVKRGASIGSGATIMCGLTIGERAVVGAGSVVTRDVPAGAIVAGNPARIIRHAANVRDQMSVSDSVARNGASKSNGDAHHISIHPRLETRNSQIETPLTVPFLNLRLQHEPIRAELQVAIDEVIDASAFAGGRYVEKFEREFAQFCGSRFCSGVGNGTDALWFALLAVGVKPGDEVITVPSTFMATAEAISFCGARPVFVDIEEDTCTMNPALLDAAITPRTKAIVPVHLFGQMADMEAILAVARKHGLPVIEDACQAHGAEFNGRKAGSMGDIGCFSFYPGKNLGALGEAGAIVTDNPQFKQRIDTLRDHGQIKKYHHTMVGWNGRMDGIQAAVLSVKLKRLAQWNEKRRQHAQAYAEALDDIDEIILPKTAAGRLHVFHIYAVRAPQRDELIRQLAERGVSCGIHYPIPVHLQEAYAHLGLAAGAFPVAERCAGEFLSLPMFPELSAEQVEFVCSALRTSIQSQVVAT